MSDDLDWLDLVLVGIVAGLAMSWAGGGAATIDGRIIGACAATVILFCRATAR